MFKRSRRLRWLLLAAATVSLAFVTSTALAGSGVGGVFNLGQINTVNQQTSLTGNSGGNQLYVSNTNATGGAIFGFTPTGTGVRGQSGTGAGVFGVHVASTGTTPAVRGLTNSTTGVGVKGIAPGDGTGVVGEGGATGVHAAGTKFGVDSNVDASGAVGIRSITGASANDGVQANTSGTVSDALQGVTTGAAAFPVFAIANSPTATGIVSSTGGGTGVFASSNGGTGVSATNGSATNPTVLAKNFTAGGTAGNFNGDTAINVQNNGTFGVGIRARVTGDTDQDGNASNDGNDAIYAQSDDTNNDAVITAVTASGSNATTHEALETFGFADINGDARVTGTLTKGAGAFEIDHPLDPAHYYLRHSFVESPDMKNVYDGVVRTGRTGRATVKLPAYFGALNKSFRYQLTVLGGQFVQAIVSKEIPAGGRTFEIRTQKPRVKVSWQVTGIRKDAYANAHRIKVVERKQGAAAGMYLHPELFGHPHARPLGLDLPQTPPVHVAKALRRQAAEQRLIRQKTAAARREAAR